MRMFIRALWGVPQSRGCRMLRRRLTKMPSDLLNAWKCPFHLDFVAICFGHDNYKACKEMGFESVQVSDKPFVYDLSEHFYGHKIASVQYAFDKLGATELVYLDWDCYPIVPVTDTLWEELGKKSAMQAPITRYARSFCPWRADFDGHAQRYLPNGGFVYMRGNGMSGALQEAYDATGQPCNDEVALAWLADKMDGGWKGIMPYCEKHEPMMAEVTFNGWCPRQISRMKKIVFRHKAYQAVVKEPAVL